MSGLSYEDAGVSIAAGNRLVDRIKQCTKATHGPEVLAGIGQFAALYALDKQAYHEPVLVSATDGVGTKLKLALEANQHEHIGVDLVAMCVNDLAVMGAKPLFFLDYFATGALDIDIAATVVQSIARGCQQAQMALIGGETAEMPGHYQGADYDLAGFAVGVIEKAAIIDGSRVQPGHALIAVASNGPHANGYSLIRHIMQEANLNLASELKQQPLAQHLLAPTTIYSPLIQQLLVDFQLDACAHITGGGLVENVPRVLPQGCRAVIQQENWEWPAIFRFLQEQGNVSEHEMRRTFNCGVGLVLAVPAEISAGLLVSIKTLGYSAWTLGYVDTCPAASDPIVFL